MLRKGRSLVASPRITKAQNSSDWAGGGWGQSLAGLHSQGSNREASRKPRKMSFVPICDGFGDHHWFAFDERHCPRIHHDFWDEKALHKFIFHIRLHGAVYSVPLLSKAFHFACTSGEIAFCKLHEHTGSGSEGTLKAYRAVPSTMIA